MILSCIDPPLPPNPPTQQSHSPEAAKHTFTAFRGLSVGWVEEHYHKSIHSL